MLEQIGKDIKGQGLVEYGLILALVSVVAVGALGGVGDKVKSTFDSVANADINEKIAQGHIPVATAEELRLVGKGEQSVTFGKGTNWESDYNAGLDGNYILVSDIDLFVENFDPIGDSHKPFTGSFDGGGYVISNLTIKSPKSKVGLFGYGEGAFFNNVIIENADIEGGDFTGGLAGHLRESEVTDSSVNGRVHGLSSSVGGLIGSTFDTIVEGAHTMGTVIGQGSQVGGVIGRMDDSFLLSSYSFANVEVAIDNPNGLVGVSDNVGGLVGASVNDQIDNCYAAGDVMGTGWNNGGLIGGIHRGTIVNNSYSTGVVSSNSRIGGLVGHIDRFSSVKSSYYDKEASKVDITYGGAGLTTKEMKSLLSYDGWDFDTIWQMNDGEYPTLR